MRNNLLLLIFILFSLHTFSQNWEKGYIVNLQNDTAFGLIKSTKFNYWEKIFFKKTELKEHKTYYSNELKSYNYLNENYYSIYLPQEVTGIKGNTFAKKLSDGKIKLYHSKFRYFACACEPEGAIRSGYILIKRTEILIATKKSLNNRIKNKEDLAEFLSDNVELSYKILNNQFRYNNIPMIVNIYNEEM